jgi:hypothetical protein
VGASFRSSAGAGCGIAETFAVDLDGDVAGSRASSISPDTARAP